LVDADCCLYGGVRPLARCLSELGIQGGLL